MGVENGMFGEDPQEENHFDDENSDIRNFDQFSLENIAGSAGVDISELKRLASEQNSLLRKGIEKTKQRINPMADLPHQEDSDEWDQSFRNLNNQPE